MVLGRSRSRLGASFATLRTWLDTVFHGRTLITHYLAHQSYPSFCSSAPVRMFWPQKAHTGVSPKWFGVSLFSGQALSNSRTVSIPTLKEVSCNSILVRSFITLRPTAKRKSDYICLGMRPLGTVLGSDIRSMLHQYIHFGQTALCRGWCGWKGSKVTGMAAPCCRIHSMAAKVSRMTCDCNWT
jgi:hypothetical protein